MGSEVVQPNPWMMAPFGLLLAAIALAPLFFSGWWGKHFPKVAYTLGAVTLGYYLFGLQAPARVLHTAHEYVSFITLIASLYIVSGGIHITVQGGATPLENVRFLFIGALIANVLGTTGASMLLIRPWLRMNKYRVTAHHVVFFIFIVANVGGCLTPVGDPPLFLGYLKGIPFWWVLAHCWPMWVAGVGVLLAMFYFVDRRNYRRAPKDVREQLAEPADQWRCKGLPNLFFLGVILGAVFLNDLPVLFLREALMIAAALGSYYTTRKHIHEANHFNFHPIQEVAILFAGIFATMMPALDWLGTNARSLGAPTTSMFYWGSGTLSSLLDNAPTYLAFLQVAGGTVDFTSTIVEPKDFLPAALKLDHEFVRHLVALSIGSVFFGACTYIGNGPNFMVKAIADQQKVHTPDFLGYIFKFTLPFMLPMLLFVWWVFFRA